MRFLIQQFQNIDVKKYVEQLFNSGKKPFMAKKSANVIAVKADGGEKVDVYTKNGNLQSRQTAKQGDIILTRADQNGKPVIDSNGHKNSWIVPYDKFSKKYDLKNPIKKGVYAPIGGPQKFIQIDKDISFNASWGLQNIKAGGYLNISDQNDIYGIAKQEFEQTYKKV